MAKFREQSRSGSKGGSLDRLVTQPVLLVEDSESVALFLSQEITAKWGCDVHVARSYAEAKECLKKYRHDYHLVICDLNLPDAPNGEIIDLIDLAKLKSIVITGAFGDDFRATMAQKRVVDYMLKQNTNSYAYVVEQVGRLFRNKDIHVLVVEDSAVARSMLTKILELQNFVVSEAKNAAEALEALETNRKISLIVTDYNMPDMDGIELTVQIRKNRAKDNLAIIGVSAQGESDLGVQFIKNGANDFMLKPFSHEELICRINQNIEMLEHIETIHNLANRDYLSNLYNRRYFFNEGKRLLDSAISGYKEAAVAMMDIDFFKRVNDDYGHDVGDQVLQAFSDLLDSHFSDALVARLGGEEFAVFMVGFSQPQVGERLESFRATLEQHEIVCGDHTLKITTSIGVNCTKDDNLDIMLKVADEFLYQAKEGGRNVVKG